MPLARLAGARAYDALIASGRGEWSLLGSLRKIERGEEGAEEDAEGASE